MMDTPNEDKPIVLCYPIVPLLPFGARLNSEVIASLQKAYSNRYNIVKDETVFTGNDVHHFLIAFPKPVREAT